MVFKPIYSSNRIPTETSEEEDLYTPSSLVLLFFLFKQSEIGAGEVVQLDWRCGPIVTAWGREAEDLHRRPETAWAPGEPVRDPHLILVIKTASSKRIF